MPKMKTHSGAAKRMKKLKSGLIKYTAPGRRHLLTKKSAKRKRGMRRDAYISSMDVHHVQQLLPTK
jgi:large subunit ribosomal protein L35